MGRTTTITLEELQEARNAPILGSDGEKIGLVGEIWVDEANNPEYLKVGRGALGLRDVFVPVQGGRLDDEGFHVPYTAAQLDESPDYADDDFDEDRHRELRGYYDRFRDDDRDLDRDSEQAMTRSEEELSVGKRDVDAGSVRLRKYVETEPVEMDVELKRETARVTREPVDRQVSDAEIGEDEVELPLHEEEAVVQKQAVAKERVGLAKDVESEHRTVSDEVRKERVEVDEER